MPQLTMLFGVNIVVMLQELIERRGPAVLAGEGEGLAERVKNVISVFIEVNEKVEHEWATILLGDNSLLPHDFLFITCCWLFGSIRIICRRSTGRNMQQCSLFYFFQLFSSITTALLSLLHLFYPHAFAISSANQSTRNHLAIIFFYIISLSQAVLLLAYCYLLKLALHAQGVSEFFIRLSSSSQIQHSAVPIRVSGSPHRYKVHPSLLSDF